MKRHNNTLQTPTKCLLSTCCTWFKLKLHNVQNHSAIPLQQIVFFWECVSVGLLHIENMCRLVSKPRLLVLFGWIYSCARSVEKKIRINDVLMKLSGGMFETEPAGWSGMAWVHRDRTDEPLGHTPTHTHQQHHHTDHQPRRDERETWNWGRNVHAANTKIKEKQLKNRDIKRDRSDLPWPLAWVFWCEWEWLTNTSSRNGAKKNIPRWLFGTTNSCSLWLKLFIKLKEMNRQWAKIGFIIHRNQMNA